MDLTLKGQFAKWLDYQVNNPLLDEMDEDEKLPFNSHDGFEEDGIFIRVTAGSESYLFEYNCCMIYEGGTAHYSFWLANEDAVRFHEGAK